MNDTAQPKARTPRFCHGPTELVPLIWDLVSGLHQGQRAYRPHQKAVHMTAAAKSLVTKVLAKGPSTYDRKIFSKLFAAIAIDGVLRRDLMGPIVGDRITASPLTSPSARHTARAARG